MEAKQFWNRFPDLVRQQIVKLALKYPEESSRQMTYRFIGERLYFVSESSVYRILKSYDLIESPAFEVITAKDKYDDPTRRVLERAIAEWVAYYNNQRYHESLKNVTSADVYFGREKEIIKKKNTLKEQTLALRRQEYLQIAGV